MLAVLYLILCAAFGICFVGLCVPDVRRLYVACSPSAKAITHIPNTLFTVPAGIVTGLMCVPFFNYFVILGLSYVMNSGSLCMKLGILITFAFFIWMILTCLILINRRRVKREELKAAGATMIEDYQHNVFDSVFYGVVILIITIMATFLMFYTYRVNGTSLLNGASTFSDLSPHTAMVSSFGKGFNFPTQYMHFSGDGIKYHFFFYFLCGMLEYLGLPIDYAINFPSIITMVSALVLLGLLAVLLSSRRPAFAVAPVLVFFRSSLNAFVHIKEFMDEGDTLAKAVDKILKFDMWFKVTEYDDWGIWAINVYPNQRHLMLGVAVIIMMVIIFLPFLRRLGISISRSEDFGEGIKAFAFSKNAWLTRSEDPLYPESIAFLACVLVIVMPYFHGSCLIALLLVLFGMALVSESRLLYLAVAVCGIISSFVQTLVFSGGYNNVVSFVFTPGFILGKDASAYGIARYLFIVTGLTLILATVFAIVTLISDLVHKKPVHRFLLFLCVLNPLIFAFLFQVTMEVLANHKFIQITLILADAFVAAFIANLLYIPLKKRKEEEDEPTYSVEADDVIDGNSMDGDLAVVAADSNTGVRTPVLPSTSAFGEPLEEKEEEDSLDIEAMETHTGVDADVSGLSGDSDNEPAKKEEEIKEEKVPEELLFGDDKKESEDDEESEEDSEEKAEESEDKTDSEESEEKPADEEKESSEADTEETKEESDGEEQEDDSEAKAGVAALAALFGKDVEENKEAESEDKSEDEKSEEDDEPSDEDDSDEALKESQPEPAHVAMRPGTIALNSIKFGEDEPEDDDNVTIASADAVIDGSKPETEESEEEELEPETLKHEPVKTKKEKGLPYTAWFVLELAGIVLAAILMVPLTATGVSEWATYVNINRNPLVTDMNSPVTRWIAENTEPSDVFLTPYTWSMNRFILAGRPMYYGWPYYAWSAGHDTNTRDTIYQWLISGCDNDVNEFTRYCKERNIKYLIIDSDFYNLNLDSGVELNKEFVERNLKQVAYFAEEDTTIYKIF